MLAMSLVGGCHKVDLSPKAANVAVAVTQRLLRSLTFTTSPASAQKPECYIFAAEGLYF